jgi:hypothetical protein
METALRPLGIVRELIEELGHEITYAYDDLVFIDHNGFLLRFGQETGTLELFFNTDCPLDEVKKIETLLLPAAEKLELKITRKGSYTLNEKPDNNIEISFFEF